TEYTTDYTPEGNTRQHYTTTVFFPTDNVSPDYVGSMISFRIYYYYFELDGQNITASGWEGTSIENPPPSAREPFGVDCRNPGIDHQQVMAIVNTVDDPYEENDSLEAAATLSSGRYRLIALDSDFFKVALKSGDKLNIWVTAEQDGEVSFRTYHPSGSMIEETIGSGEQKIEAETTGDYTIEVFSLDPLNEPIYSLIVQQELQHQGIFPLAQSGIYLNTIGILDPEKNEGRLVVSLMDKDGLPEKSYYRDSLIAHLGGEAGADFDLFPSTNRGYLRIDADFEIKGGERVSSGDYLCMGSNYLPASNASSSLYYSHLAFQGGWKTFAGIINLGNETEEVLFQSFDENGEVLKSDIVELASGQKIEYEAVYMPVFSSEARSMKASTRSGRESLAGYLQFRNPSFGARGRALIPLPLMRDHTLIIPHVASNQFWSTGIVVVNTGESDASLILNGYDDSGQRIGDPGYAVLKPGQNFVRTAAQIFGRGNSVASMRIVSTQPLAGFMIYASTNNVALAGVPATGASSARTPLHLSSLDVSGEWLTGIAVVNSSDIFSAAVSFSLFDEEGECVGIRTFDLDPYQRMVNTIRNIFDRDIPEEARYLEIDAFNGQPLSGLFITSSPDGLKMMGGILE
ncbi:MAG: hypothetical protein JRJ08_02470, partial [Deltaproteobacteria bacterium]|nr:hypothetical protein [Deltaproteobacteria bacterium]